MAKRFNISGLCRAADNCMLSATERLPNVVQIKVKGEMVAYGGKLLVLEDPGL